MAETTYQKKEYVESDAVKQAYNALQSQANSQPGAYASKYQTGIDDTINKIMNREKFSYDLNGDALYQQYKDQYTTQGKMAMMDTMGQAAAMTGGYGSSFGQSVGQQAYQGYLQQLNDVVPELYQMAYDRYSQEGQDLYNQYSLLSSQDQTEYGRHRDSVSDYYTERDYLAHRYDSERNYDYSKYTDDRNFDYTSYVDDRNYNYQVGRDEVADAQWQQQYDEAIRQYNQNFGYQQERDKVADSQWNQTFEYQQGRDQVSDSQWQATFDESMRQYNSSLAEDQRQFNESMNFSKQQYEEAKKASSSGGGGGNSGGGNAALSHVASMSSADLVETMQGYNADGDNNGLAAFLDDCVASGRLTEAQADNYYSKYRKGTTPTKTTTPPAKNTGGAGGKLEYVSK